MKLSFTKYHGTGNDFIVADNRASNWVPKQAEVRKLCDRHFGIGADGLILIENDEHTDFYMNYYNSDGSQSFCGNGSRCAFDFAKGIRLVQNRSTFCAIDGTHTALFEEGMITISMGDTGEVETLEDWPNTYFINTGSPHVVRFVDLVEAIDLKREGAEIRYNERFSPEGSNVNFVQRTPAGLKVRTYERGVEDETLSCGTGVAAVALVDAHLKGGEYRSIITKGGLLEVGFRKSAAGFGNIKLTGSATPVFKGEISLEL